MPSILVSLFLVFSTHLALGADCQYSFDMDKAEIKGTGYKTSKKIPVSATFSGVELNKSEKKKEPKELLKDLEVSVNLVTIDSGNGLRDGNLRETLFAGILGDSVVTVKVKEVGKNKIKTDFKLNEQTQEISFEYTLKKDVFHAKGQFDVVKFAMGEQVAALKKRCGSLHTGDDGKSVTWTDFAIEVTAPLIKECGAKN